MKEETKESFFAEKEGRAQKYGWEPKIERESRWEIGRRRDATVVKYNKWKR